MHSSTAMPNTDGVSEFQANLDIFRQLPLFGGLAMEPVKLLAYLATRETLRPGEILFHRGDAPTAMAVILEGELGAHADAEGETPALVWYKAGDSLGGLAVLGRETMAYTVRAVTPVQYLTLTREKLWRALEQFPEAGARLCEALATRVAQWDKAALDARSERRLGVSLL